MARLSKFPAKIVKRFTFTYTGIYIKKKPMDLEGINVEYLRIRLFPSHRSSLEDRIKIKLLVALCLVAVVAAAPPPYSNNDVQITRYENDNLGNGAYRYIWDQTDGQRAEQTGEVQNVGREDEALSVTGSFSWVAPDGVTYIVRYTSGVQGYKPEIEQGPGGGVPPAVLASLIG